MVHLNVHASLREIQLIMGILRSTANRYLRYARYHSYHITVNQALTEEDYQRRIKFCQWATQQITDDEISLIMFFLATRLHLRVLVC